MASMWPDGELEGARGSTSWLGHREGSSWDFPLSRADKVRRVLILFEAEMEASKKQVEVFKREKDDAIKEAEAFRATVATRRHLQRLLPSAYSGSPSQTPPTPPPRPRLPRATAPAAPTGRRRSSVVVIPGYPGGFDFQAAAQGREDEFCFSMGQFGATGSGVGDTPPRGRQLAPFNSPLPGQLLSPSPFGGLHATPGTLAEEALTEEDEDDLFADMCEPGPHYSDVKAIKWGGGNEAVDWITFVRIGSEEDRSDEPNPATGEHILLEGEYIQALRGRAEVADGRAADWVVVVTSRQTITMGYQGVFTPTFSFHAEPGHELVSIEHGQTGWIEGARQKLLSTESPGTRGD